MSETERLAVLEAARRLDAVDGLTYREIASQPYSNCAFSAGFVDGHPVDTLYLKLERDGEPWTLLLRPDEAQAICWVLNGTLWSDALNRLVPEPAVEGDGGERR